MSYREQDKDAVIEELRRQLSISNRQQGARMRLWDPSVIYQEEMKIAALRKEIEKLEAHLQLMKQETLETELQKFQREVAERKAEREWELAEYESEVEERIAEDRRIGARHLDKALRDNRLKWFLISIVIATGGLFISAALYMQIPSGTLLVSGMGFGVMWMAGAIGIAENRP